jgi:hypothetical protein
VKISRKHKSERAHASNRQGDVAELAFILKATNLGFSVSKPYGNHGRYDFVVDSGERLWRVQVKSTSCRSWNGYTVNVVRCSGPEPRVSYSAANVDWIAVYVAPRDPWYLVPVHLLIHRTSLMVHPDGCHRRNHGRYEPFREAWHLLGTPRQTISSQPDSR